MRYTNGHVEGRLEAKRATLPEDLQYSHPRMWRSPTLWWHAYGRKTKSLRNNNNNINWVFPSFIITVLILDLIFANDKLVLRQMDVWFILSLFPQY